jgi:hypothetical protein
VADRVLQIDALFRSHLERIPFAHALVEGLFRPDDAAALAASFPRDHYRIVRGTHQKAYRYDARPFVAFGTGEVLFPERLSTNWQTLGAELASPGYRRALAELTGVDLDNAPLEVNLFHYGPRSVLEPHLDLPDKLVTHVLYFNQSWERAHGGCLRILRSSDPADFAREILPLVGASAVLVRSDRSWHAVPAVRRGVTHSRRSMTVTFYRPGSTSTLFPRNEDYRLVDVTPNGSRAVHRLQVLIDRVRRRFLRSPWSAAPK